MVGENVALSIDGPRASVTLHRPPLNILNIEMLDSLRSVIESADRPGVRVLVLRAEGKAFSAGVDVADHGEAKVEGMVTSFTAALRALLEFRAPTVAAVHGACFGGGLELALACDLVYAAESASLGQPEIEVGVFPPFAAAILPRLIGERRARELIFLGRRITAEEARAWGLVNGVFPDAKFEGNVDQVISVLASHSGAVARVAKKALRMARSMPFDEAWRTIDRVYLEELMRREDAREGLAAFLEKRKPVWKDR